jgi:2-(1,2-epoxy-1,2-dihydrophenyl)acetyl-CoA isomerase
VDARQALEWGLVNFVHSDDAMLGEAEALAERLAAGPTRSYAASKEALNRMIYPDMEGQLHLEAELQHKLARSQDFVEGVGAFVEKRQAAFTGS